MNLVWGDKLLTFYNDAYRAALLWSLPDGIGQPYPQFRPDVWPRVEHVVRMVLDGDPVKVENINVRTKRGGTEEDAFFRLECIPILDGNKVAGALSTLVETTQHVQIHTDLRDENRRLTTLLDLIPQMVWSTRPDGYHDFYSQGWYEFTGAALGSTDGDGWNDMFHPDDSERAWAVWRHSLETGVDYEIRYRLRHADGSYRWMLGRARPQRGSHGEIVRWYGTCTDIDDEVQARARIDELQAELTHLARVRAMDSMAATLAHEVNQPLGAAANLTAVLKHLIRSSDLDRAAVREVSKKIEEAVLHAGHLIKRLRQQLKRRPRTLQVLHLEQQIDEAITATRHLLDDGIAMRAHCEANLHVQADPVELQQVLTNILKNAAEAANGTPGASVTVSGSRTSDKVCIVVTDTGAGFADERLQNPFGPFTSTKAEGLGIGLSICRTIVESLGGNISLANAAHGGAEVTIELPSAGEIQSFA
ncbi:MAG TPA: ATP-binding protein [Sphingomicrobium sp.]|jgi:PAS domain S-box-containing protein